jgi:hypothetical protein
MGADVKIIAGCSKGCPARPQASRNRMRYPPHFVGPFARIMDPGERINPSRTSASENLNRYVENFDEPGTTLADFFSILLPFAQLHRQRFPGKYAVQVGMAVRRGGDEFDGFVHADRRAAAGGGGDLHRESRARRG